MPSQSKLNNTNDGMVSEYERILESLSNDFRALEDLISDAIVKRDLNYLDTFKSNLVKIIRRLNEESFRVRHEASWKTDRSNRQHLLYISHAFMNQADFAAMLNMIVCSPNSIEAKDFSNFLSPGLDLSKYFNLWLIQKHGFRQINNTNQSNDGKM
jgi:hypothetical protein